MSVRSVGRPLELMKVLLLRVMMVVLTAPVLGEWQCCAILVTAVLFQVVPLWVFVGGGGGRGAVGGRVGRVQWTH